MYSIACSILSTACYARYRSVLLYLNAMFIYSIIVTLTVCMYISVVVFLYTVHRYTVTSHAKSMMLMKVKNLRKLRYMYYCSIVVLQTCIYIYAAIINVLACT
jgi:hypothetical protein